MPAPVSIWPPEPLFNIGSDGGSGSTYPPHCRWIADPGSSEAGDRWGCLRELPFRDRPKEQPQDWDDGGYFTEPHWREVISARWRQMLCR